tara:strand:- start:257 stop:715 length:459 start_codon:yes stop_codon:yes gene_type:complete
MLYKIFLFSIYIFFFFIKFNYAKEYISIKDITTKANLRAGPGNWYPVKWVISNPGLPLKFIEKSEGYFYVQLHDGTKGWLYKTLISYKNNIIVIKDSTIKDRKGLIKAKVLKDVIIKEHNCNDKRFPLYCKIKINKVNGYLKKTSLWGYRSN